MLHIILLILKIIGIILLVLIGLLLLILLTVLLVPVRYVASVSHGEEIIAEGSVSWLLHILGAKISYLEGELHIRVRVLWITLYDNMRQEKTKRKRTKRQKTRVRKNNGKKADRKDDNRRTSRTKKDLNKNISVKTEKNVDIPAELLSEPEVRKQITQDKPVKMPIARDDKETTENQKITERKDYEKVISEESQDDSGKKVEKTSVLRKIINKIKRIKTRTVDFFRGIKRKITGWFASISNIKQKINIILEFLRDEYNKEGFHVTYASVKKLLKHILPKKLKSRLVFGTGDPCSTGQALGAMSILYSFYGDKIMIIPDFENKRFEGEHFAKGRIRAVTVLLIVIKLLLNKRFKQLKSNFQILKEAL
jgi:hypothetical protein